MSQEEQKQIIYQVIKYIGQNFTSINVSVVANYFSLNSYVINKLFQEYIGCDTIQYIFALRIAYACNRLTETFDSEDKIAKDCGYLSSVSMYYLFKRTFGYSPKEFREKYTSSKKIRMETYITTKKLLDELNEGNVHRERSVNYSRDSLISYNNKTFSAFRQLTGHSLITYINLRIIENSKKHLLYSNTKMPDICQLFGIDYPVFLSYFKRYTGVDPLEYRQGYKNTDFSSLVFNGVTYPKDNQGELVDKIKDQITQRIEEVSSTDIVNECGIPIYVLDDLFLRFCQMTLNEFIQINRQAVIYDRCIQMVRFNGLNTGIETYDEIIERCQLRQ